MAEKPPKPRWTPPPYQNGANPEPPSGVFHPRTGRTRKMVKWGAVVATGAALLTPIVNAVAARIYPPAREQQLELQLRLCQERLGAGCR